MYFLHAIRTHNGSVNSYSISFPLRLTLLNVKSFEKQREGCLFFFFSSTCVSRCPPRSFPNQGGVCWPCHESCEICAGAGQDSCLSCAPAHLRVTDLAVCLQQCPEGYYESTSTNRNKFIFINYDDFFPHEIE